MSGPKHEGEEQILHMLWARVHHLKDEGYRIDEIAYLIDKPIREVKRFLNMAKPMTKYQARRAAKKKV